MRKPSSAAPSPSTKTSTPIASQICLPCRWPLLQPDEYPTVRAISSGETTDPEDILYRRGDGTQVWIRATAAPVRGKNGDIVGAVLAIQDIDETRQEKQELLDRVADLERQLKTKS